MTKVLKYQNSTPPFDIFRREKLNLRNFTAIVKEQYNGLRRLLLNIAIKGTINYLLLPFVKKRLLMIAITFVQ